MSLFAYRMLLVVGMLFGLVQSSRLQLHDVSFSPDYVLRITYGTSSAACRTFPRVLVNGTAPGPKITLTEGQTSWIRVYNDMEQQNLTVHWHGLSQAAAPFSDGTPQASQWPIKAKHFFDYELKPSIGDAGTYFYHSHVQFQAVSASGPLVVEEASGRAPYSYDDERTIFLSEVYNKTNAMVAEALLDQADSWSGETEAILINGQSYPALDANQSATPPPWTKLSPETTCRPEVIEVEPGKTYRFRSIGGQALSLTSYMIEDHDDLTVITADGRYTKPASTSRIQTGPGQRFDFLLKTKTDVELKKLGKSNFWIQFETRYRPVNVTSYAVLKYTGNYCPNSTIPTHPPREQPLKITDHVQTWLEYTLEPLQPNGFPKASEVTRRVYLIAAQILTKTNQFWTATNHTWTEQDQHLGDTPFNDTSSNVGTPYLVNIFEKGERAIPNYAVAVDKYGGWDPELDVWAAEVGEVIDIIIVNQPNGAYGGFDTHPWHIHGGHVWDLGSGNGTYDPVANEQKLQGYNPVLRDTTYLYQYIQGYGIGVLPPYSNQGWRAWRLKVDDAGVWMVHCHILQHMMLGMQTVWVMGNASQITRNAEPYVQGYLSFGGDAYGNASYDPLVYHHFDV